MYKDINIEVDAANWEIELTEGKVSYKERKNLSKEHFLDPGRKSFPIRPGKECEDLHNALHRLGTYTGSIPRATLHSKIERLMKKHGCSLPKSWDKEKK